MITFQDMYLHTANHPSLPKRLMGLQVIREREKEEGGQQRVLSYIIRSTGYRNRGLRLYVRVV